MSSAVFGVHGYRCRSAAVFVAVAAAMVSCTDAATVMLKLKEEAMRHKGSVAVDGTVKHNSADEYNLNAQNFTNSANGTDYDDKLADVVDDAEMSAVWYLAAFGGLVLFFFVVTCSELFLANPVYARRSADAMHAGYLRRRASGIRNHQHRCMPDTPPPPYHLFAPPSYDDTVKDYGLQRQFLGPAKVSGKTNKKLADVYVVPVHAATTTTTCCTGAGRPPTTMCTASDVKPVTVAELPQTKFK
ncbi:Hypothetical protein CINCED_3A017975 [Cinara cedri]|uniref:Uncharacterized protein n=1 Tax=Cinara cedri TaxID=506608 RepID=A0A5E4N9P9_9HEMI|nr:Hypothetical protein CINCED_3A017975 [Cinara cedri]